MYGDDPPIRPIQNVQRLPVLSGKTAFLTEFHAGRGAQSNVDDAAEAVSVMIGPAVRFLPPAIFAPRHDMHDAGGAIPGSAGIPLHVGVVREQLSVAIESNA